MLSIRMQRTGRKNHAQYRVVVQDSRQNPKSGRVVANLGTYNPHSKVATLDTAKAADYLKNGAQPSERVVAVLTANGVKMPAWVEEQSQKTRGIRNPEKLRKNQPKEEPVVEEAPAAEEVVAEPAEEAPTENPAE